MKKTITLMLALLGVQFSSYAQAQAYDGYNDIKMFLGYTNIGGNSGIEYQTDKGVNDLYSWGGQAVYLFDTKVDNEGVGYEKGFKFLDSFDAGIFIRFHFLEALKLPENLDLYLGGDLTLKSLGAHTGIKYNLSKTFGFYAMYKQSFAPLFKGDITLSEDSNGEPIPSFFAKKAALSFGVTINFDYR